MNIRQKTDSGLWVDLYELAMAQTYFKYHKNEEASFELFIRSKKRPFYIAYGVSEALDYLSGLRFDDQDLDYLRSLKLFSEDFLKYLKNFRFQGEVWAVDEPEIIFPQEPILRVTAPLIEAQIAESALLNTINLYTTLATKAARVVSSARARKVYDFSLRRTQGAHASLAAAKASFVSGAEGTSCVLAGKIYGIPVVGTMAHSFVMSFSSEFDSFYAFARTFPDKTIILIDTYDIRQALCSTIKIAQKLQRDKFKLVGVRIDSGDLVEVSKSVRMQLDTSGLIDVIILASGNLDEYKIKELIDKKAPIDAFGVGTNMGTSSDLPFCDVIYKLVEIRDCRNNFIPVMKFSEGKLTYPLRKQIFRKFSAKGIMKQDFLVTASENVRAKAVLKKVMDRGEIFQHKEDVFSHRKKLKKKLEGLPAELKDIDSCFEYPVVISTKLNKVTNTTKELLKKRLVSSRVIFFDIDTQSDFVDKKGALAVKDSDSLKGTWAKLTKYAQANWISIVSSQDTHAKSDPEFKEFAAHCVRGSRGCEKISQTVILPNTVLANREYTFEELFKIKQDYPQIIIQKSVLDIFSNPNVKRLIEVISPEMVYVYGVATEYCVKLACLGLKKIVDNVFVVEDAIKEISKPAKETTFSEFKKKGIKFISSVCVLEGKLDG